MEQKDQSEMTSVFANLKKAVDKLHFRGHRGSYCHEFCNPHDIKELEGVNTPVCEQTFSWLNKYNNCRNMNEARFYFFFLYLIDLRNLSKEKKVIIHYRNTKSSRYQYSVESSCQSNQCSKIPVSVFKTTSSFDA